MKIGLFGGAFDPIHLGHTRIIQAAIKELNLDLLLIIPTQNNPWKESSDASSNDRIAMIELAIQDIPQCQVCTIEIEKPADEKNYSIDTIKELKERYSDDELFFIMGMDQASQFDKWKKAKKISKLVQLVAFKRTNYKMNNVLKEYNFKLIDVEETDESSTGFKKGHIDMINPAVLHYISEHGLYLKELVRPYMSKKRYLHTCSVAKLAAKFARHNGLDETKAYVAGMLHDVAKEMNKEESLALMNQYYHEFIDKPLPVHHQWISAYVAKNTFLVDDKEVLQAIENHTTASIDMTPLDMCVYCADKLDPLRGYDSSEAIALCKDNIVEGFKNELKNFYHFSKKKGRDIDPCFFEIYKVFCKGELNE